LLKIEDMEQFSSQNAEIGTLGFWLRTGNVERFSDFEDIERFIRDVQLFLSEPRTWIVF
jgi:hypothetical protein